MAQNAEPQAFGPKPKNAVGAFVLEYLIPGAGHIYARDTWGAVNVLGMVAAGTMMSIEGNSRSVASAGVAIALIGRVWGLVDAPRAANRHNRRHAPRTVLPAP